LRVFVSSTLGELAEERRAVARAISALRLAPVMFELGARPYPPREVRRVEDELVTRLRHGLGASGFDQAFSAGSGLTQREAVAIVRDQRGISAP
jgi:hypothetical protein